MTGIVFDPVSRSVQIHDSPWRLYLWATASWLVALLGAGLAWKGYEVFVLGAPRFRGAAGALLFGSIGFVFLVYHAALLIRRTFDDEPDLIVDTEGITDRWLRCGRIPWSELEIVEAVTYRHLLRRQRLAVAVRLKNARPWAARSPWHIRLVRTIGRLAGYPRWTLPSTIGGLPVSIRFVLWVIAQYQPTLVSEEIDANPFTLELRQASPNEVAKALEAIYGAKADDIAAQLEKSDSETMRWRKVREELAQPIRSQR